MKVHYLEKELSSIGILVQNSLSGVAERLKELLTRARGREDKMSDWQLIILQSKANGCLFRHEDLPQKNWEWPKNTWFQERAGSSSQSSRIRRHSGRETKKYTQ
jgi:hypothetical protein